MKSALWLTLLLSATSAFGQMTREQLAGQFATQARQLSALGVEYGTSWTPPGHPESWTMDCSNTVRWFYQSALGKDLPRTASAQYEALRAAGRYHPGLRGLKPGDLLFWENTCKPSRQPPVTHVMIYLGRDPSGRMLMAGAQRSHGVDIYLFNPAQPLGGYTWFLWFKKKGRFIGYARPA